MTRLTLIAALATLTVGAPAVANAQGLGSLFSCNAQGSANTTGAVVGGLVGALAGSQISKNERGLGAVIGAGLGAAIGNNVGCRMDRKAQQDAQQAFQRALDTGKVQNWSDPQSGASGRIEVLGPVAPDAGGGTNYPGRWRYAQGVTATTRVSTVGGTYAASNRINMRAAPSTSAAVVDRLQPDEPFEVAGAVAGGWLAVIEDGFIQGYVARSVVRPAGGSASGECRLVEQTVNERGQPGYRERFNACRDGSGAWRLTAV
ncbi:MAG: glycine zipper 2TM domain-containing protein [Alphaproteobacteria bacterium]|nr:glycine zipper 2TM domain-containing protein [Alphaproteobacteria bacterium]MBU1513107.1 glycine zipper 2TM domain-containing protein [Alphaproteobacteria bacterium]MBU2095215.1 glycine zipper 2TM domain-containing protein [Alphaproteobacteria bacterium]MBU2150626.1 glycine zipper 2TM domain-containing protein [Alphaproteobacteria bacterium]MBU2306115.1 glycine zipper 2TM domain-containing protein [Alphaproteobacteria bacterium]